MDLNVINEQDLLGKNFKIYGDIENPLFLAKDIAEWIEYDLSSVNKLVNMVDENEKVRKNVPTLGGSQESWFITEDGLYEILMQSRKPIAKEFKREVKLILKEIRKTGGFVQENRAIDFVSSWLPNLDNDSKNVIAGMLEENKKLRLDNDNKSKQLVEQKPLVDFADTIIKTKDNITMNDMAKLLNDENISIGRNKLFEKLRDKKILMSSNVPYQRYIDNGWFKTTETVKKTPYGDKLYIVTLVTPRGQVGIVEMMRNEA